MSWRTCMRDNLVSRRVWHDICSEKCWIKHWSKNLRSNFKQHIKWTYRILGKTRRKCCALSDLAGKHYMAITWQAWQTKPAFVGPLILNGPCAGNRSSSELLGCIISFCLLKPECLSVGTVACCAGGHKKINSTLLDLFIVDRLALTLHFWVE